MKRTLNLELAKVASSEDLAYEANRQLKRVDAQGDGTNGVYASPGSHSTLILSDDTGSAVEGNAAEIIYALAALPDNAGRNVAWDALADFPVTCDCGCCNMWYCNPGD